MCLKKKILNRIINLILQADKETLSRAYVICKEAYQNNTYQNYRTKYDIADTFRFNGAEIRMYGEGIITCGHNSYIGELSTLQSSTNNKIKIGHNTQISHNVRIYTQSNIADQDFREKNKTSKNGNVIIGNYVWIGANVLINPGVSIGDNSVIGANSVVTKNIDSATIVGGVPAKLIKHKTKF